jgi:hypothetical protein
LGRSGSGPPPNNRCRRRACMATADVQIHEETEAERIERWRQEELERAGYSAADAAELAASTDVDLHTAIRLLEQGCDRALALRILL